MTKQYLDILRSGIEDLGLDCSKDRLIKLDTYITLLIKWNKTYNLTSITKPEEIVTKHLLDSLVLVKFLDEYTANGNTVLDAGCGAGLPSIPCAIFCPHLNFTAVDAVQKKISFVTQVCSQLKLNNVQPKHIRLESNDFGERFDVITSRAFASLKGFTEITGHLLKRDGTWFALKGKLEKQEINEVRQAHIKEIIPLSVPNLSETRNLVILKPI